MMIYIGSDIQLPIIPFNDERPAFHTRKLGPDEMPVKDKFSFTHVLYIGSDSGCSCGFKHALIDGPGIWYEVIIENEEENDESHLPNHYALHNYLSAILTEGGNIELYACWDGSFDSIALRKEQIPIEELEDPSFFFKERVYYQVIS